MAGMYILLYMNYRFINKFTVFFGVLMLKASIPNCHSDAWSFFYRVDKARSALAHNTGLGPLNNCLLSDGLKDLIGVKLAWMLVSCSSADRA